MKKLFATVVSALFAAALPGLAQQSAPLALIAHFALPDAPAGHFDHLSIDLRGHRLFAADEGGGVEVVDTRTGKVITAIKIGEPHDPEYHASTNRLYVTDGSGYLRVFNGTTLRELTSTKLWDDLDPMAFDPQRDLIFTESGGGDLHQSFSHFTTIDPRTMKVVNDLKIDGTTLEWMQLAKNGPQIYLNNRARDMVTVVDRDRHAVVANWPIQGAHINVAMAYDPAGHLIFVGCRSGQMVVMDTRNGKQIASEPLGPNVDDMVYDPASHRVYAATDGNIDVFTMASPTSYSRVEVKSAKMGKTALLVSALRRYYVAVPKDGNTPAEILVYRVNP